jgi:protocatechuate 3,4-dioxygenase beta subunit
MKNPTAFSRRTFLTNTLALATTLELQRAAFALGLLQTSDVCKLTPEQEVGPYYVAEELFRSNIVEDRQGVPLELRIAVLDARTCKPLTNAAVDIWHCDALGLYSGYTAQNPMGPGGSPGGPPNGPPPDFDPTHPHNRPGPREGFGPPPENHPTDKLTFLRGIQITARDGSVNFRTVFPGFYMGRTNHIHFKVRIDGHQADKTYAAGHTSHVGQVFFPEEIATQLMQHEPYTHHKIHRTTQTEDHVFSDQNGQLQIANLKPLHIGDFSKGLRAELIAAVDTTATPPAQRMDGPPREPGIAKLPNPHLFQ